MALGCSIAHNQGKKKNSKIFILQELELFFHNFVLLCLKLVKIKILPCFQKEIIKDTHEYIHIHTDRHIYTSTYIHTYINSLPFQVQKYQTNLTLK